MKMDANLSADDNPYRAPEEVDEPPIIVNQPFQEVSRIMVIVAWLSLFCSILGFLVVTIILMTRHN